MLCALLTSLCSAHLFSLICSTAHTNSQIVFFIIQICSYYSCTLKSKDGVTFSSLDYSLWVIISEREKILSLLLSNMRTTAIFLEDNFFCFLHSLFLLLLSWIKRNLLAYYMLQFLSMDMINTNKRKGYWICNCLIKTPTLMKNQSPQPRSLELCKG